MRLCRLSIVVAIVICLLAGLISAWRVLLVEKGGGWMGRKSVADQVREFGPAVRARLSGEFERVDVGYPPARVTLIGLKAERVLEVWVAGRGEDASPRLLKRYPILGASGVLGPKLREGDRQAPEGIYSIESLNPNSAYHLALRIGYPNATDRARAAEEGRENLGGDIMIHGGATSVGCLAMGDAAAEDLFVIAAEAGIEQVQVILSPVDFRVRGMPGDGPAMPEWVNGVYKSVRGALSQYREDSL